MLQPFQPNYDFAGKTEVEIHEQLKRLAQGGNVQYQNIVQTFEFLRRLKQSTNPNVTSVLRDYVQPAQNLQRAEQRMVQALQNAQRQTLAQQGVWRNPGGNPPVAGQHQTAVGSLAGQMYMLDFLGQQLPDASTLGIPTADAQLAIDLGKAKAEFDRVRARNNATQQEKDDAYRKVMQVEARYQRETGVVGDARVSVEIEGEANYRAGYLTRQRNAQTRTYEAGFQAATNLLNQYQNDPVRKQQTQVKANQIAYSVGLNYQRERAANRQATRPTVAMQTNLAEQFSIDAAKQEFERTNATLAVMPGDKTAVEKEARQHAVDMLAQMKTLRDLGVERAQLPELPASIIDEFTRAQDSITSGYRDVLTAQTALQNATQQNRAQLTKARNDAYRELKRRKKTLADQGFTQNTANNLRIAGNPANAAVSINQGGLGGQNNAAYAARAAGEAGVLQELTDLNAVFDGQAALINAGAGDQAAYDKAFRDMMERRKELLDLGIPNVPALNALSQAAQAEIATQRQHVTQGQDITDFNAKNDLAKFDQLDRGDLNNDLQQKNTAVTQRIERNTAANNIAQNIKALEALGIDVPANTLPAGYNRFMTDRAELENKLRTAAVFPTTMSQDQADQYKRQFIDMGGDVVALRNDIAREQTEQDRLLRRQQNLPLEQVGPDVAVDQNVAQPNVKPDVRYVLYSDKHTIGNPAYSNVSSNEPLKRAQAYRTMMAQFNGQQKDGVRYHFINIDDFDPQDRHKQDLLASSRNGAPSDWLQDQARAKAAMDVIATGSMPSNKYEIICHHPDASIGLALQQHTDPSQNARWMAPAPLNVQAQDTREMNEFVRNDLQHDPNTTLLFGGTDQWYKDGNQPWTFALTNPQASQYRPFFSGGDMSSMANGQRSQDMLVGTMPPHLQGGFREVAALYAMMAMTEMASPQVLPKNNMNGYLNAMFWNNGVQMPNGQQGGTPFTNGMLLQMMMNGGGGNNAPGGGGPSPSIATGADAAGGIPKTQLYTEPGKVEPDVIGLPIPNKPWKEMSQIEQNQYTMTLKNVRDWFKKDSNPKTYERTWKFSDKKKYLDAIANAKCGIISWIASIFIDYMETKTRTYDVFYQIYYKDRVLKKIYDKKKYVNEMYEKYHKKAKTKDTAAVERSGELAGAFNGGFGGGGQMPALLPMFAMLAQMNNVGSSNGPMYMSPAAMMDMFSSKSDGFDENKALKAYVEGYKEGMAQYSKAKEKGEEKSFDSLDGLIGAGTEQGLSEDARKRKLDGINAALVSSNFKIASELDVQNELMTAREWLLTPEERAELKKAEQKRKNKQVLLAEQQKKKQERSARMGSIQIR